MVLNEKGVSDMPFYHIMHMLIMCVAMVKSCDCSQRRAPQPL